MEFILFTERTNGGRNHFFANPDPADLLNVDPDPENCLKHEEFSGVEKD